MSIYEEAREALNILDAFEKYGFRVKRVGNSWRCNECPICGVNSPKSVKLVIFPDSGWWYCHRCGEKGDVIRLVAEMENVSRFEAARMILTETASFTSTRRRSYEELQKEEIEKLKHKIRLIQYVLSRCTVAGNIPGWNYLLKERKISQKVLQKVKEKGLIRFLSSTIQIPFKLAEKAGYIKEKINQETGEVKQINIVPYLLKKRPIIFPFNLYPDSVLKEIENPAGAEFRATSSQVSPKAVTLGVKGFWYWKNNSRHLLIVEGFIDLLSALTLGWKGEIIALCGVQEINKIPERILQGKVTWLCLDNDEAGHKATNKFDKTNYIFLLPDGIKDLNEALQKGFKSFKEFKYLTVKRPESKENNQACVCSC